MEKGEASLTVVEVHWLCALCSILNQPWKLFKVPNLSLVFVNLCMSQLWSYERNINNTTLGRTLDTIYDWHKWNISRSGKKN